MAGSPVWGKAFHEGQMQGRIEGVTGSAVVVALAGVAYGTRWALEKRKQRKLEKLEAERIEEILKHDRESKDGAARQEQNEA